MFNSHRNILLWKSPAKTNGILLALLLVVWGFDLFMIPLLLIIPFMVNLLKPKKKNIQKSQNIVPEDEVSSGSEDELSDKLDPSALRQKVFLMQVEIL